MMDRKQNYPSFIYILIFIFVFGASPSCTLKITEREGDGTSILPINTINTSPTPPIPFPLIHSLSEIVCEGTFISESNTYPSDKLSIGTSTVNDIEELYGTPDYVGVGTNHTTWRYSSQQPFQFVFVNNILVEHSAARKNLDEIIAYYGIPGEIVWQIPKKGYHGSSLYTYLLFPDEGAIFYTLQQVVRFTPETQFELSDVVALEEFDSHLASYRLEVDTEFDQYIHFEWPCSQD